MKITNVIVALWLIAGPKLSYAQSPICGGADAYASAQLTRIRQLVAGADSLSASVRAEYHLPSLAASDVQLVTNDSVCTAASSALRQTVGRTDAPIATTWVIQVGTERYWVYDFRFKSAVDTLHAVFDKTWTNLALITG